MINTKIQKLFLGLALIFAVNNVKGSEVVVKEDEFFRSMENIKEIIGQGTRQVEALNLALKPLVAAIPELSPINASTSALLASIGLIGGVTGGVCLLSSDAGKKVCIGDNITLQEKGILVTCGVLTLAALTAGVVGLSELVKRFSK